MYDVLTPSVARLWAFPPDWSAGFNVRRSYATDIIASRDNTEQRRSLRFDPRFSAEYKTIISGEVLQAANLWLRAWHNKPTIVPDFARWARLTGDSISGASALTISPLPVWAAEGQRLLLCGNGITENVLVASVAGSTITLEDPLVNAWATGAVLRPTFHGLFEGKLSSSRITKGTAEISVAVSAYPGGEPPRAAGTAWATLNSREIFTPQPDYAGAPSLQYLWPVEEIDFDRGRTAQFRPMDRAERQVEADFNGCDVTLASEIEQFFDRMKGRRSAFYLPTWEKDFNLSTTAPSAASAFVSTGLAIANDFGAIDYAVVETAIAICLVDGTQIYRKITDIAQTGSNSLVTVDSAWGADLSAASVARISWMPVCRFASDDMTTSWRTPLKANVRLVFQSVKR